MAGTLSVSHIQGLATHSDPTSVTIASGHKLKGTPGQINLGAGTVLQVGSYCPGYGDGLTKTTQSWSTVPLNGTGAVAHNTTKSHDDVIEIDKKSNNSHLELSVNFPFYLNNGASGIGLRCQGSSSDTSINSGNVVLVDLLPNGPGHGWSLAGYGGNTAGILNYTWSTRLNSNYIDNWKTRVGGCRFYWEAYVWSSGDTLYLNTYDGTYPFYGMITWREVLES